MSNFLVPVWDLIERPYAMLGLQRSPFGRFAVTAVAAAAVLYAVKPESLFYRGEPRPPKLLVDSPEAAVVDATTVSLLIGGAAAILV
jgi:hypothetical protein